jgi:GT2 family glycosyltransferase
VSDQKETIHLGASTPIAVSVIIVAWNSGKVLSECLGSLENQTYKDFEVIVIDNGSTDIDLNALLFTWKKLKLRVHKFEKNHGFAYANNFGVGLSQAFWIVFLNADAFPRPDWLENLLNSARHHADFSFFTSRQIQANSPDLLDGAGDEFHISGLAWRRYYNQPVELYGLKEQEVFSACAAAALYRREDFLHVGGFDEDYFAYFEDVDLSFRLRLAGGKCLYVPDAIVHHVGSASTGKSSDFSFYHGHRNLVWTYFKDMPIFLLLIYLPLHLAMNIYLSLVVLIRQKRNVILKSKIDAFRSLPTILKKRKEVQKLRRVSEREIYRVLTKDIFAPRRADRGRSR